jgi:8-oxo-dGTP pyrophosphatase MutT (NUDIX family)
MFETFEAAFPQDCAVPISQLILKTGGRVPPSFVCDRPLIASQWRKRCLANPHLFNGTVFLQTNVQMVQGCLTGAAVELDYASFMHWRGNPPFQSKAGLVHVFPLAAIESSDGHLIAVRSAATTVNSGMIYFAAGMFDDQDVVDGRLDHYVNMQREVREETGLELGLMKSDAKLVAFRTSRFLALFQRFVSCMNSDELVYTISQFITDQATPEIDDVMVIRSAKDISEKMPGYMRAYCHWRLAS